uniref:Syntaxin 6/10/61 N-terminal domain-containing protein n=1 Tax=Cucumis melo TaxID=3656 RepID=A0A1S4E2P4_CUCME
MLVANSFDLWKKDGFFSAAEQVQESADTMEFAYRTWIRERREGLSPDDLDELRREVQTALGTAKWQVGYLEEFEKAVRVNCRSRSEEHLLERHRLFIAAIGNQISHVEAALRKSYDKEGRQPLRWVNLNEEECNDLATFLSGVSEVPQSAKTESSLCRSSAKSSIYENHERVVADMNPTSTCSLSNSSKMKGNKYVDAVDIDSSKVKDLEVKENFGRVDDALCKMDRSTKVRRASPPTVPDLQIVIVDENQERKQSITSLEVSRKGKSGPVFWKRGCGKFSQLFGRVQQRQMYRPWHLQLACSVQFTLALMLTIFLIGVEHAVEEQ